MSDNISYNLFTAKQIDKLLGINSNRLYHWVQTKGLLEPTKRGIGRGNSNYFSIEDLATLSLIKILSNYRIDLWEIKSILSGVASKRPKKVHKIIEDTRFGMFYKVGKNNEPIVAGIDKINMWQIYKLERELLDEVGFILRIAVPLEIKKRGTSISLVTSRADLFHLKTRKNKKLYYGSILAINLIEIIRDLEKKTGLKF